MTDAQNKAAAKRDHRISTGVTGLDEVLEGGFPAGHFFLIEGEPGTGKTTLGLQFLMDGARHQEPVLYVTLSESQLEIEKVARSHGWSLEGVTIFEFTPGEDRLRAEDQYSAFHPSEVEFQDTTISILNEVERVQPSRVVLDSLSEIRLLARDSLRYRRQVLALKHFFSNRNCTVLLLDDRTSGAEDLQLQSIAHGVLMLEKVAREFGRTRRRVQVSKLRGSSYREGYHDYSIVSGGVVVCPRLVAREHSMARLDEQVSSGVAELDSLWGGGLERGTSTLLLGPAGSGKSSVAMAYAIESAKRGQSVSIFLFEELVQLACKRAASLGLDPGPYLDCGSLEMTQIDPAELSPGEFIQRVRAAVEQRRARMIIIDSLNGLINAMPGELYLPLQIHELLSYLNQSNVITIMVLAQAGMVGNFMTSPVDLSYLADNVLLFRYFEAFGRVHKAISVVKKRSGSHEDTIRELGMRDGRIIVGGSLSDFRGVLTGVPTYVGSEARLEEADGEREG